MHAVCWRGCPVDGIYIVLVVLGFVIGSLFSLLALAIALGVLLGWIVLLVMGISRLRKGSSAGVVMTVLGFVWAAVAVAAVAFGAVGYRYASSALVPTDFNADSYHGTVGDIILPNKTPASLVLAKEKTLKRLRVEVSDGMAKAPVGSYKVERYLASATNRAGNEWTAEWNPDREESPTIVVGAAPVHLDVGPPFVVLVTSETQRSRAAVADFTLVITGAGNRPYTVTNHSARASPPGFQVLDNTGRVVWRGSFEYG